MCIHWYRKEVPIWHRFRSKKNFKNRFATASLPGLPKLCVGKTDLQVGGWRPPGPHGCSAHLCEHGSTVWWKSKIKYVHLVHFSCFRPQMGLCRADKIKTGPFWGSMTSAQPENGTWSYFWSWLIGKMGFQKWPRHLHCLKLVPFCCPKGLFRAFLLFLNTFCASESHFEPHLGKNENNKRKHLKKCKLAK